VVTLWSRYSAQIMVRSHAVTRGRRRPAVTRLRKWARSKTYGGETESGQVPSSHSGFWDYETGPFSLASRFVPWRYHLLAGKRRR
jgi:hypothetical protein